MKTQKSFTLHWIKTFQIRMTGVDVKLAGAKTPAANITNAKTIQAINGTDEKIIEF